MTPETHTDLSVRPTVAAFAAMREHMVESQLRTSDVNDPAIVRVMAQVPREAFAPRQFAASAYIDRGLPLGNGREMSPALTLGRMLIAAAPEARENALVVGGATGYAAAVLAPLVRSVTMVEEDAMLADIAAAKLSLHRNVQVVQGPLSAGAAQHAPFDLILVDGAIEEISPLLTNQLAASGRVIAALSDRGVTRLARGVKSGATVVFNPFADMEAPLLPGFSKAKAFQF